MPRSRHTTANLLKFTTVQMDDAPPPATHPPTVFGSENKMPDQLETYEQAIDFLYGRINYERIQAEAYSTSDFKLDRMRRLLELMDNPHEQIPVVHVAGTKGKGSTCSMIASMLTAAGYSCGLYISPHINDFEERFSVNGLIPSKQQLVDLVNRLMPIIAHMDNLPGRMQPTYFELATALAWQSFLDNRVDIAVLEVGLGGRLDSTNLCHPLVTMITNVSRDHTHVLGSTVHQIAYEKAGIIKPGIPVISGADHVDVLAMIEKTCADRVAPLKLLGRDFQIANRTIDETGHVEIDVLVGDTSYRGMPVILRGPHQSQNAALALAAINELRVQGWKLDDDHLRKGLRQIVWPARVEVVARKPTVIIDAAHNWESARALIAALREGPAFRKKILIFAATKDKDVSGILRQLIPEFDTIILTRYVENPRGVPVAELHSLVEVIATKPAHVTDDPESAWQLAKELAQPDDLIVVTGSFFLIAELRSKIARNEQRASDPI